MRNTINSKKLSDNTIVGCCKQCTYSEPLLEMCLEHAGEGGDGGPWQRESSQGFPKAARSVENENSRNKHGAKQWFFLPY